MDDTQRPGFELVMQQVPKRKKVTRAGLGHVHPHMLRHSCGHALANKGMDTRLMQDWLGYRDIRHTAWYSSTKRFDGVWE